jgi:hypothetical protein
MPHDPSNSRIRTRMSSGMGGAQPRGSPYPDSRRVHTDSGSPSPPATASPSAGDDTERYPISVKIIRTRLQRMAGIRNSQLCLTARTSYWVSSVGCKMNKASEYRERADECRTLARQMTREDQREALLRMAETWDSLADDREQRQRRARAAKGEECST